MLREAGKQLKLRDGERLRRFGGSRGFTYCPPEPGDALRQPGRLKCVSDAGGGGIGLPQLIDHDQARYPTESSRRQPRRLIGLTEDLRNRPGRSEVLMIVIAINGGQDL